MSNPLEIPAKGDLDFLSLGALVHRLDSGIYPFHKAASLQIHVSGGEFNTSANLSDCFGMRTAVASAMVDYPVGDLINERVRAMGVRPFYKRFKHDGARGPNMATVYSDRGHGVRAPVVFYNRSNEAAALLKPGDFDWKAIFAGGVRWFHSGGIFAALSETTAELIIEAMQAAKNSGAIVSFDLNYREKLWNASGGGHARALEVMSRIVKHVDVLVGNEEDLQKGLGIPGPEVAATSGLDSGRLSRYDRQRRFPPPADQGPRHHAARGALHEPPHVERCRVDCGQGVRRADLRARCARSRRRRRWLCVGSVLRPHERRDAGRGLEARVGAWRADHHLPGRYDDGHARAGAGVRQRRLGANSTIAAQGIYDNFSNSLIGQLDAEPHSHRPWRLGHWRRMAIRMGTAGRRRLHRDDSARHRARSQLDRHGRRSTGSVIPRKSSGRRCAIFRAASGRTCSRNAASCGTRLEIRRTASIRNRFAGKSNRACAACRPSGSICTRFTGRSGRQARRDTIPASIEEAWTTLTKLRDEGKVAFIGVSNFDVAQLQRISRIETPTNLQPPYSMLRPEIEQEILPFCLEHNIGVIPYSPMQSGLLTGKMTRERIASLPEGDWRRNNRFYQEPMLSKAFVAGRSPARDRREARPHAGRSGDCLDAAASGDHRDDRRRAEPAAD